MPTITILNHGTANSTNRETSGGSELVISRLGSLMNGREGLNWILNEGAGTDELKQQLEDANVPTGRFDGLMGVAAGKGVEQNVAKSVKFAESQMGGGGLTVNLVGHSRGSITCYKIASALARQQPHIPVNIFAIDPVPGNNGLINEKMYEHIGIGNNVRHSFLLLAESEHRLNFRPYIDEIYTLRSTIKQHKFDTIPGTHGGINELTGGESEAASLVLNRALKFLKKHGSDFKGAADDSLLSDGVALSLYSRLMMRLQQYKNHATVNPFKSLKYGFLNLGMSSGSVEKHRIVNISGEKLSKKDRAGNLLMSMLNVDSIGGLEKKQKSGKDSWGTSSHVSANQATSGRSNHHGLNMNTALQKMGVHDPHNARSNRFFANQEHQKLFGQQHPTFVHEIENLEKSADEKNVAVLRRAIVGQSQQFAAMRPSTQAHLYAYCQKMGVLD